MRGTSELFWDLLTELKISEEYFLLYVHHSKRRVVLINAICLIASFTGLVTWFTENLTATQSSLIVIAAQLVSALQPLYPYEKRLYAADCIYKAYTPYAQQAELSYTKYLCGDLSPQQLKQQLNFLQQNTANIKDRFCSPDLFPRKMFLHEEAKFYVKQYLTTHFSSDASCE